MKHTRHFALLIISWATISSSVAEPIGINFGSGRDNSSLTPADSAGVIPQTNWNNAPDASGGPLTLNDSTGTATSASVTWSTDEQWSIGGPAADPNGTLLNGWISANNTADPPATVAITGIPFTLYDLYVYSNHDRATEDVLISESSDAFPPFLLHENDTDILAPVTFQEQPLTAAGDASQTGNYVKFAGLSQSDLELVLSPAGEGGSTDRGAITGIQIIEVLVGDADGDGLEDAWESNFGLDPNDNGLNPNNNGVPGNPDNGANGDPDNDGSTNLEEQSNRTFPNDEDSDNDTLLDGVETNTGNYVDQDDTGTDPLNPDSDDDNLSDGVEDNGGSFVDENMTGTDPNKADTDNDTLIDSWEIANDLSPFDDGSTNPNNGPDGDPDSDDSTNANEQTLGTFANDNDSDDDTLLDGAESNTGTYVGPNDTGTDPLNPDTDGDNLNDGVETNTGTFVDANDTGTDPFSPDTDGDIFSDGWEVANNRNPLNANDNAANAGSIGLNLGAGRDSSSLAPTDLAGVALQTNWNNLVSTIGTDQVLNDETGANSGTTVTWAMDEEWSIGGPGLDANGTLLNGWLSANGAGATNSIDISNIPYGNYDLVFYVNHDRATEDVLVSEANNAFAPFLAHENDSDILAEITFAHQAASAEGDPSQSGNFFVIPNLTNPNLNLLFGSAGEAGSADRGSINGIQIINRGAAAGLEITSITPNLEAGSVTITWNSVNGRDYAIDAASHLELTEADEIDDFTATGDVSSYTEFGIDFTTMKKRFYRIRELTN